MGTNQEITASLNEIWEKLNTRWKDENANHFYQQYMSKMTEVIEDFEAACSDLGTAAADLSKKLQLIEQSIDHH